MAAPQDAVAPLPDERPVPSVAERDRILSEAGFGVDMVRRTLTRLDQVVAGGSDKDAVAAAKVVLDQLPRVSVNQAKREPGPRTLRVVFPAWMRPPRAATAHEVKAGVTDETAGGAEAGGAAPGGG